MGDKSSIEWLQGGATWNPIRAELLEDILDKVTGKVLHRKGEIGWLCIKISPGCAGCYACGMNLWRGNGLEYTVPNLSKVRIFLDEKTLLQPLRWKRPRLIFPCSMTDWMADFVPDEFRDKMLAVMALTPQHTYLTLTKRAARQREYLRDSKLYERLLRWADWIRLDTNTKPEQVGISDPARFPLRKLWLGISCENQQYADERIPDLLQTPASVRWVSAEPLLGPINFTSIPVDPCIQANTLICWADHPFGSMLTPDARVDWIVAGGESGPKGRPMHPDWVRSIRDQCLAAGVPFFFKQWGAYKPFNRKPGDDETEAFQVTKEGILLQGDAVGNYPPIPHGTAEMLRVGKHKSGRQLDGREWNEYPV